MATDSKRSADRPADIKAALERYQEAARRVVQRPMPPGRVGVGAHAAVTPCDGGAFVEAHIWVGDADVAVMREQDRRDEAGGA